MGESQNPDREFHFNPDSAIQHETAAKKPETQVVRRLRDCI